MHGSAYHCVYGSCNSDSRPGRPGYSPNTRFFRFPKPCLSFRNSGASRYNRNPRKSLKVVSYIPTFIQLHLSTCDVCQVCSKWVNQCRRRDQKFSSIANITKDTYICSKHFPEHTMELDLDLLPVPAVNETKKPRIVSLTQGIIFNRQNLVNEMKKPRIVSLIQGTIINGPAPSRDPVDTTDVDVFAVPVDPPYLVVDVKVEKEEQDTVELDPLGPSPLELGPVKLEGTSEKLALSETTPSPSQKPLPSFNVMAVIKRMKKIEQENEKLKEENRKLKFVLSRIGNRCEQF